MIFSAAQTRPRRDIVLLNAAAALGVADDDLAVALAKARECIDNGRALATLEAWIAKTNSFVRG